MSGLAPPLKPRKRPIQARSTATVRAIHEATLQVLLAGGFDRLTTTRVAARAGVSVGTLYQYFPERRTLLASVLEVHLLRIVDAVEAAAVRARGQDVDALASTIVDAFVDAKFAQAGVARALHAIAARVEGAPMAARAAERWQAAVAQMLAAAELRVRDVEMTSYVICTALIGPMKGVLESDASPARVEELRMHLTALTAAYLGRVVEPARKARRRTRRSSSRPA